ncbi:MAG: hypothetical protein ACYS1A_09930 [Planctomycetota bacterium]|jgi:hypothetical protein
MKTKKLTILVVTVILLTTASLQAEEKTKLTSNTRTASCLVKVTIDPAILPLNYDNIEYLLSSSAIAGKAGREVLNISHNEAAKLLEAIPLAQSANLSTSSPTVLPTDKEYQDEMMRMMQEMGLGMETMDSSSSRTRRQDARDSRERSRTSRRGGGGRTGGGRRRTSRTTTPAKSPTSTGDQPLLFHLHVELPDEVQPLAEEFLTALTDNLQQTLTDAYGTYDIQLRNYLQFAHSQRDNAQAQLSEAMALTPADVAAIRQLEEIVGLSQLSPEMSLSEAIEELRNAVEPPLQIIVLWRDLIDSADIDQTTPINMDAVSGVSLKAALKIILKSVSGGLAELAYEIENGIITIATRDALPTTQQNFLQNNQMDISVDILLDKKQDLLQDKQELEMEVASLNARRSAIEIQIAKISKEIADKVKDDPITVELQGIVDGLTRQLVDKNKLKEAGRATSAELDEMRQKLARTRLELARELSNSARTYQLAQFNNEYANSMVGTAEKTAMLRIVTDQLRQTEQQLTAATTFDPRLSRMRTAREAFEIADRRVNQLEILAANLQPPTVTVLGVN